MSATTLELPVVREEAADVAAVAVPAYSADAPARSHSVDGSRVQAPRVRGVLAPLLPTMVLVALCVAGLSDPPAPSAETAGDRPSQSRLHVPTEAPYLPAVPLTR